MTTLPVRIGAGRAWIEIRNSLSSPQDLASMLVFNVIMVVVAVFLRHTHVAGAPLSLGATILPGVIGMSTASMGLTIMTQMLTVEREDGTLLRAKATPGGTVAYLVGKVLLVSAMTVVGTAVLFVTDVVMVHDVPQPLTFVWVLLLGLVATIPLGAICGSLFPSPRSGSLITLLVFGLSGISGIFYPITRFPQWLQDIAQVFPIYWIGLGMRSALLPGDMAVTEIGGAWRQPVVAAVLAAWAVTGLALAPFVLRRMARRESGSTMAVRRARALQRVG